MEAPAPELERTAESEDEGPFDVRQLTLPAMRDYYEETYTEDNALGATMKMVTAPKDPRNVGRRPGFHSTGQVIKFKGIKCKTVNEAMPSHTSYKDNWPGEQAALSDAARGYDSEIAIAREPLSDMGEYDITGADGKPRCILDNTLFISNAKVAQNLEGIRERGVTHIVNLTGFKNGVDGEPQWPNPFPEDFVEGETYLHICKSADKVVNRDQSSRLLDLDTDVQEYVAPAIEFVNKACKEPSFGGCLIHSGEKSITRAAAVCIGYLLQEGDMKFTQAYGLVIYTKLDIHPHRSFMRQLMIMSEKLYGACPPKKESKKCEREGAWGARWQPYQDRFGETKDGFQGVAVPTAENPDYFKIKAFTRCIYEGASGKCINDETPVKNGGVPDGFCDVHRPKAPGAGSREKQTKRRK